MPERKFNVTGTCVPSMHYMVDISNKLKQIKVMVDAKEYFTINRGRQYGKTTTLLALEGFLREEYIVISISFEGLGEEEFANAGAFCSAFLGLIKEALELSDYSGEEQAKWEDDSVTDFMKLSQHIRKICRGASKEYVLFIDEVDKASNNVVFLNFLSILRKKYLARRAGKDYTFHSIILAGVYDIRNIKLKLIQEGLHTPIKSETTTTNSPWNIAAGFDVDMSFSIAEIETMLMMYEKDCQISMNTAEIAEEIYQFTSGYPVLVSRICKFIDEEIEKTWNVLGVREAVKLLLKENSPLFESLFKNLESNQELSSLVYSALMVGEAWSFTIDDPIISLGFRYGYLKEVGGRVRIANKIFEMRITTYFANKAQRKALKSATVSAGLYRDVIRDGTFNMQLCLEKFAKYYHQYYSEKDSKFLERESRFIFLFFLSPILNGRGFAHIESHFTDDRRMDVVVNYQDQQFIIELKIWDGKEKHRKAYDQLLGYMEKRGLDEGYLLTFDFRQNKAQQRAWITVDGGRKVFDIIV